MLLLSLVLGLCTLIAVSLQKTYSRIPLKELKRRASKDDEVAKALYRAASYGISLQLLLWAIIGLSAAGFFVTLSHGFPSWLALFGSAALLWVAFAWLPNTRITNISEQIARTLSPIIAKVLSYLYPLLSRVGQVIKKYVRQTFHTGLYQTEDLIELLDKQNKQLDNRITSQELLLARHALVFDDKLVRDVMTPRRVVKLVSQSDSVGPILLDELHKSGFSRFPVTGDKPDELVGTLYLRNLVKKQATGKVKDLMSKDVYYVNEQKTLGHVLNAFITTKHHLFIVVNSFEEFSGVITIEDVLEQLIGRNIVDEFDKYDDLRAVAALAAKKDQQAHKHVAIEPEPESSPEKK